MVTDDEKPARFGCLTAARWMVASAVTVAILVVISYSVVSVLRPGKLTLQLVGGHVSVNWNASTPNSVPFYFTLRAINPSGRIRIYFYSIIGTFSGPINGSSENFLRFGLPDIAAEQQSSVDTNARAVGKNYNMPKKYFELFSKGRGTVSNGMLTLNGTRVVEIYSGHNNTDELGTIYYCTPLTFGVDNPDDTDDDVQCTEHMPASASG